MSRIPDRPECGDPASFELFNHTVGDRLVGDANHRIRPGREKRGIGDAEYVGLALLSGVPDHGFGLRPPDLVDEVGAIGCEGCLGDPDQARTLGVSE